MTTTLVTLALAALLGQAAPEPAAAHESPMPDVRVLEAVRVEGDLRTRPALILRILDVEVGAPLDERRVERGRRRIAALGLFHDVRMRLERGSEPGHVVLVVSVDERGSLLLSDLFLGFTTATPFYGGFGVADANVAGTGLMAHGAFVMGSEGRSAFRVALTAPAFVDRDLSAGLSLLHLRGVELDCPAGLGACVDRADLMRLHYRRTGGRLSLGRRGGRFSRVHLQYRFEDVSGRVGGPGIDPGEPMPAPFYGLPSLALGSSRISTLGVAYEHDSTDDPFLPRAGTRVEVQAEVGSRLFHSSYEYARYGASVAWHRPGARDHGLRLGLFGGFVQGDAPFFDRFHVADHSYFTIGANAVPRALGISFTEVSQYDDVLVATDLQYRIPLRHRGAFVYRGYFYAAAALTLSAHTVEGSLLDLSLDPRNEVSRFPLSGDVGVRLDTAIGVFSLGLSYPLDLLF
jgi:outer membrane protein insertion porin family